MQLDKYKGVIKMVVAKYPGADPSLVADEILKSIEIAQAIAGEVQEPVQRNVSMETLKGAFTAQPTSIPIPSSNFRNGGAILISAAPPVADAGENSTVDDDDVDYYESKPGKGDGANRLQELMCKILPASIQVKVPAVEQPLTLIRGVGSPGIKFVYVNYTLAGASIGCRVTLMTSQKTIYPDAVLKDIVDQAAAIYSGEKRVIVPHAPKLDLRPSDSDLAEVMKRERERSNPDNPLAGLSQDDAKRASEDAAYFRSEGRSDKWRK